ncbi:hypothetical protein DFR54_1039 [Vagococcus fluvialis]|uniref:Uncharacterized protein n=1 Tax=Vagococcus fluvialis TaxID=2738 RepID=A0A369B233_9ENTE|nr:hypothetical protein [Vagococcus fluvialis]RCX14477.1 hypothetical protein DFR54_1039 [Vagococcus fluvialis]RSU04006.1 hypothetical protein CBF32_04860 [Vagococcus fluvialis]UDM71221.1 hypothetical protein K5L00_14135 [Vagococcus fluvialis]UDM76082.1 hypothetical protein K5K98_09670 [Vagococcus fluvialis]UDM82910.1 hypothetical protein K5K96_02340 [Vagococcus fluvialis]
MNKSGKIFWLLLSILFAVGSITAGTIYDGKRKKNLEIQTVKTTSSIKLEETNNDIEEKGKTSKTEESKTKTKNSEEDSNLTEADSTAVTNAENLISVIIVDGQVGSNFTLDDYKSAKLAVDNLPSSSKKTELSEKITQIETALTNMGIAY